MSAARVAVAAFAVFAGLAGPAGAKSVVATPAEDDEGARPSEHVVVDGDSLWTIARRYGCMPEDIKRVNRLESNLIHPGKTLAVPARCGDTGDTGDATISERGRGAAPPSERKLDGMLLHEVESGDTLFKIAKKYDSSVDDLKLRNGLTDDVIRPGQRLDVAPGSGQTGRAISGQSIGRANSGRLARPTRLARGAGYYIRRPERAYGANHAVHATKRAIAVVRKRHPKMHTLAIGDLSAKKGGKISGHHSHQSGRDVDVGLVFKKRPKRYPQEFVVGNSSNLDLSATWTMVDTFAGMADADNGVERVFLGYNVQKLLYRYAKKKGVPQKTLGRVFQYPHGRETPTGIVRHEPAHDDHLHVRFKCPKGDKACI